jgi:SPW repeat
METNNATAHYINIALGIWLFVSAFIWPRAQAQMTNTWILGLLCVIFAALALRYPQARYLNTALAVWLFFSVWALPTISVGTMWNNAIVAIAIFVLSLAPGYVGKPPRPTVRG